MEIKHFNGGKLRNDAYFQFHIKFRNLVNKENAAKLKIKAQFDAYLVYYAQVDEALKKITKSALTADIKEADKARDEMYAGMNAINRASLKHYDAKVARAAAELKIIFDTYGNISARPLSEQCSAVYNFLQDAEKGKSAANLRLVGIDGWAAELKRRNAVCEKLFESRYAERAAISDVVMKKARAGLDDAYKTICKRINAMVALDGPKGFENFIKMLNTIIAAASAATAVKATAAKKKKVGKGGGGGEKDD